MQVHERPQGAPVLVLAGDRVSVKRMQNHVPYAWLFYGKTAGFAGIFDRATARPALHDGGCIIQVLCGRGFFTIIIPRSRVRSEFDGR